jgi:hypothetical protein
MGRPNLMCNVMKKTSKIRGKKMIGQVDNQVPLIDLTHDFKCTQSEA